MDSMIVYKVVVEFGFFDFVIVVFFNKFFKGVVMFFDVGF